MKAQASASTSSAPTRPASEQESDTPSLQQRNIEAIAKVEAAVIGERSTGERWVRGLIRQVGRPGSVLLHVAIFGGWILWNSGLAPTTRIFDPYPFALLALVTGLEAIILGLLILSAQNRQQREADRRAHLHLQINMMAEIEGTTMLRMLDRLCRHFGIDAAHGSSVDELIEETDPSTIVERIKSSIPAEE